MPTIVQPVTKLGAPSQTFLSGRKSERFCHGFFRHTAFLLFTLRALFRESRKQTPRNYIFAGILQPLEVRLLRTAHVAWPGPFVTLRNHRSTTLIEPTYDTSAPHHHPRCAPSCSSRFPQFPPPSPLPDRKDLTVIRSVPPQNNSSQGGDSATIGKSGLPRSAMAWGRNANRWPSSDLESKGAPRAGWGRTGESRST